MMLGFSDMLLPLLPICSSHHQLCEDQYLSSSSRGVFVYLPISVGQPNIVKSGGWEVAYGGGKVCVCVLEGIGQST